MTDDPRTPTTARFAARDAGGAPWGRASALVDAVMDLPPQRQAEELIRRCCDDGDLLRDALDLLLASLAADPILTPAPDRPAASESDGDPFPPGPPGPAASSDGSAPRAAGASGGRRIGAYRVLRELGRGGMGTVYLAAQDEPVERRVAVKVALEPLGRSARLRLAAERQALARLSHPCIARLLEAGDTEDGHPWFAMEYVEGRTFLEHCDGERLGVEDRLRLFIEACEAVAHAHRLGILHRDLKPSNVLVAAGEKPQVKVIDFGIAKAVDRPLVDAATLTGSRLLGTPEYLAPEAVTGLALDGEGPALDTRADVYSLGVLLQELLIGIRPLAALDGESAYALLTRLTQEDPPSPSVRWRRLEEAARQTLANQRGLTAAALEKRMRGDLEWIVRKATARSPDERYSSVSELADDLRRHLDHAPILAGAPTAAYRLRKALRRHRVAVAFAAVVVALLVAGLVARTLEARRASREAVAARLARDETEEVVEFLTGLFTSARPEVALGEDPTATELLDQGVARLEGEAFADRPAIRARMLHTTAGVSWSLGDPRRALELGEEALSIRRRELGPDHPDTLASLHLVGTLASEVGDWRCSEEMLREGLERRRRVFGPESVEVADVLTNLGAIYEETERFEEAVARHRQALAVYSRVVGADSLEAARALSNLGLALRELGRLGEARSSLESSIAIYEERLGKDHPGLATALNNLGELLAAGGQWEEADEVLRRVLAIREKVLGADHSQTGITLNSLGWVASGLGRWQEGERCLREAEAVFRRALGPEHPWVVYPIHTLGHLLSSAGELERAETELRRALELRRRAGETETLESMTAVQLGRVLRVQARPEEAEELLEEAVRTFETTPRPHPYPILAQVELALLRLADGDLEGAERRIDRAEELAEAAGRDDETPGIVALARAELEAARGARERSVTSAEEAIVILARFLPEDHQRLVEARRRLAAWRGEVAE